MSIFCRKDEFSAVTPVFGEIIHLLPCVRFHWTGGNPARTCMHGTQLSGHAEGAEYNPFIYGCCSLMKSWPRQAWIIDTLVRHLAGWTLSDRLWFLSHVYNFNTLFSFQSPDLSRAAVKLYIVTIYLYIYHRKSDYLPHLCVCVLVIQRSKHIGVVSKVVELNASTWTNNRVDEMLCDFKIFIKNNEVI